MFRLFVLVLLTAFGLISAQDDSSTLFEEGRRHRLTKYSSRLDDMWPTLPRRNFSTERNYAISIPKLKKDFSRVFPPKDPFEDYVGLESVLGDQFMGSGSDRRYIHEHGSYFIPVPSHHEKDDHFLIPLLLLILIPLFLFAIIIPLNANLLSTLFLIMQTNNPNYGIAGISHQGRRRRSLDDMLNLLTNAVGE